jgi:hypothetical protein
MSLQEKLTMSTNAIRIIKSWDWRRILFTVVAGVVTFFLLTNLFRLAAPWASMAWYPHDDPRQLNPELHRWHEAMWGAVTGILEGGVLLMLLWRPRQNPLLIQLMASVIIGAVITVLPFEPSLLFVIVMMTLVVVTYPNPHALLDFSREGPISRPLLALGLATALLLVPYILRLTLWQLQGVGGEHATANQWISDVEHAVFLLFATIWTITRRPGWRPLGFLTGVVFLYLGVAALALPGYAGSWGIMGGILALIGGLLYLILTISEARKAMRSSAEVLPAVTL